MVWLAFSLPEAVADHPVCIFYTRVSHAAGWTGHWVPAAGEPCNNRLHQHTAPVAGECGRRVGVAIQSWEVYTPRLVLCYKPSRVLCSVAMEAEARGAAWQLAPAVWLKGSLLTC